MAGPKLSGISGGHCIISTLAFSIKFTRMFMYWPTRFKWPLKRGALYISILIKFTLFWPLSKRNYMYSMFTFADSAYLCCTGQIV